MTKNSLYGVRVGVTLCLSTLVVFGTGACSGSDAAADSGASGSQAQSAEGDIRNEVYERLTGKMDNESAQRDVLDQERTKYSTVQAIAYILQNNRDGQLKISSINTDHTSNRATSKHARGCAFDIYTWDESVEGESALVELVAQNPYATSVLLQGTYVDYSNLLGGKYRGVDPAPAEHIHIETVCP